MTAQQSETAPRAANRLLLPVPGLDVDSIWQVGPVPFIRPRARGLIEAMSRDPAAPTSRPCGRALWPFSALCESAAAEVSVTDADDGEAMAGGRTNRNALAIMRAVQYIRHPMNGMDHQAFGLPGDVPQRSWTYVVIGETLTVGAAKSGALAGLTLSDDDHQAWMADPVFRFLDHALSCPEPDRTMLQGRALLAISLLSQDWLSYKPDVGLLNSAMALEVLLGEEADKKRRLGLPGGPLLLLWMARPALSRYGRAACPLLSLPLQRAAPPRRTRA